MEIVNNSNKYRCLLEYGESKTSVDISCIITPDISLELNLFNIEKDTIRCTAKFTLLILDSTSDTFELVFGLIRDQPDLDFVLIENPNKVRFRGKLQLEHRGILAGFNPGEVPHLILKVGGTYFRGNGEQRGN